MFHFFKSRIEAPRHSMTITPNRMVEGRIWWIPGWVFLPRPVRILYVEAHNARGEVVNFIAVGSSATALSSYLYVGEQFSVSYIDGSDFFDEYEHVDDDGIRYRRLVRGRLSDTIGDYVGLLVGANRVISYDRFGNEIS